MKRIFISGGLRDSYALSDTEKQTHEREEFRSYAELVSYIVYGPNSHRLKRRPFQVVTSRMEYSDVQRLERDLKNAGFSKIQPSERKN